MVLDPYSLDPSKHTAKITREVTARLANLAKKLEADGYPQARVAGFLMRCLFTMFAEDLGLLRDRAFTKAIEDVWIPDPASFPEGIASLWHSLDAGGDEGGNLFSPGTALHATALPLDRQALRLLRAAADCSWAEVEPAIFGTLLERALDPRERHRLGAHYTPRATIERLVRPTVEAPLRAEWDVVQTRVQKLVADAEVARTEDGANGMIGAAVEAVRAFHGKLCSIRVLDPACGSGNFLYVTLDLLKRLEQEVLAVLGGLGGKQPLLPLETRRVTPAQLYGIEIKLWAKEIAELVLWIGSLQWHVRMHGKNLQVPDPALRGRQNLVCRDAVLAYDAPHDTPREAIWPEADFIVGNPPFVGNKRMRATLGDGYVDALRAAYPDVPESADYVMYWWHKAAAACRAGEIRRFGFITTNSITQTYNSSVVAAHLQAKEGMSLAFAIPNHPWAEPDEGAAVRIAMTVGALQNDMGVLQVVRREEEAGDGFVAVMLDERRGVIQPDLSVGPDVLGAAPLRANSGLSFMGITLEGEGFVLAREELARYHLDTRRLPPYVRRYRIGRDFTRKAQDRYVIDFFGMSADESRHVAPALYQRVLERVRPKREARAGNNKDYASYGKLWWLFAKPRPRLRTAVRGLKRFLVTCRTATHRTFVYVPSDELVESTVVALALEDPFFLGVLSSRVHCLWALRSGSRLGVGDDPRYNNTTCFAKFPFPEVEEAPRRRIAKLATELDEHRTERMREHPDLILTDLYSVMDKENRGAPLSTKERATHDKGLVPVLRRLHEALDGAILEAYGWPHDLVDDELLRRLVDLNVARAEEERRGRVRWLRPGWQSASGLAPAHVTRAVEGDDEWS